MQGLRKKNQILESMVAQLAATGFGLVGQLLETSLGRSHWPHEDLGLLDNPTGS